MIFIAIIAYSFKQFFSNMRKKNTLKKIFLEIHLILMTKTFDTKNRITFA